MAVILVIEGDELHADLLKSILAPKYQVIIALTGQDGLALIQVCHVSLLITSLRLPDIDGWTVIARVRNHHETKDTPIMVVTAYQGFQAKEDAIAAGCNAYLSKPFVVAKFRALVDQLIHE